MTPAPIPMMHPHSYPRRLSDWENEAIRRQCLTTAYPDDWAPVPIHPSKED